MRVAYVCTDPGIPVFGTKGASIHVQEMVRALGAAGAEVTLFSPRLGTPLPGFEAVRRHALPAGGGAPEARARHQLALNATVAAALDAAGPFDLVYERHALHAHGAMEWARARGVPGVLEVNAPLIEESLRHRSLPLAAEAEASARRSVAAAALVSAVSAPVAAYARRHGGARVEIVPNAVDPDRFSPVDRPANRFTVGFLGTLKPWHDVETLVRAMPLLRAARPDARLMIVGDGPERARLAPELDALGAELAGAVAPDAVPGWLARMDVAVAPYRADEPFYFSPLKIYEYMAAGLPVVASDVGDLGLLVEEGETGRLCPPSDPEALAAVLAALAAAPRDRQRMGATGRDRVLAHHTWAGVADRVLAAVAAMKAAA